MLLRAPQPCLGSRPHGEKRPNEHEAGESAAYRCRCGEEACRARGCGEGLGRPRERSWPAGQTGRAVGAQFRRPGPCPSRHSCSPGDHIAVILTGYADPVASPQLIPPYLSTERLSVVIPSWVCSSGDLAATHPAIAAHPVTTSPWSLLGAQTCAPSERIWQGVLAGCAALVTWPAQNPPFLRTE